MGDESGQDYAVARYRDPGRGERIGDIAAREGASPRRLQQIPRDAGRTVGSPAAPPSRPRAGAGS